MLTELQGKSGGLCDAAKAGTLRCPLIVRPTSEDVVTGHLFGLLGVLNPRWWLPDLLNAGLQTERFRRQVFRGFQLDLWQKRRPMPGHLLPWEEGATEVDCVLTWENPPTTVFVEMKYGSDLSARTTHNRGRTFPSDQLIRNARVGLHECGWFQEDSLFDFPSREFVLLLVTPRGKHSFVEQYRDPDQLRRSIPHGERLVALPTIPFLGQLGYRDVVDLLIRQRRWFGRTEQLLIDRLVDYLRLKLRQLPASNGSG